VSGENAPTPVLVAKQLIPKGTPGNIVASQAMYAPTTIPRKEVEVGAIADPSYLAGRAASADIFPGQQITTADVSAGLTDAVPTQLSGKQRAVAISVDPVRGLVCCVASGDRVDIYYQTGSNEGTVLGLLAPNVLVMRAGTPMIMRADAGLAQTLALASNTGTLWFFARPAGNAQPAPRRKITSTQLLERINSQPNLAIPNR